MSKVLTDAVVDIDANDLSALNTQVAISRSSDVVELSAMGDDDAKNVGVKRSWSMSFSFRGDPTLLSPVEDQLGETVPVKVRASSDAISATNPSWEGQGIISEFTPLDGSAHGENEIAVTIVGDGALTRVESAV